MRSTIKCYSELIQIPTLEERFEYLRLRGGVGNDTFGFDRWMNQKFYNSMEWKQIRREVMIRDMIDNDCCELGVRGYPIHGRVIIHHMNPLLPKDIEYSSDNLMNPEYLISCSDQTHRAIHYGNADQLPRDYEPRRPYDTCPWKR